MICLIQLGVKRNSAPCEIGNDRKDKKKNGLYEQPMPLNQSPPPAHGL